MHDIDNRFHACLYWKMPLNLLILFPTSKSLRDEPNNTLISRYILRKNKNKIEKQMIKKVEE